MKTLLTLTTLTALTLCLQAERELVGRSSDYAHVDGKTIDDILNNPDRGKVVDGPEILSLPFDERDLQLIAGAIAESNNTKDAEPNDGGIGYGANHKSHTGLRAALLAVESLTSAQTVVAATGLSPEQINESDIYNLRAQFDTTQPGWKALTKDDFTKVNSADDTWEWKEDMLSCTGKPVSVIRTVKEYKNFEMVVEWRHNKPSGNSGVFVWATPESIKKLTDAGKPGLPDGIEVQVLDNAFTDMMKKKGRNTDWFTTHGDVFPVRVKMTPIGKTSPDGSRSFPRKDLSKDHGNWNHYYIRAINGEVRLWVNGQEVSGGTNCDPAQGYLCLESEGSPIDFRGLFIRELP